MEHKLNLDKNTYYKKVLATYNTLGSMGLTDLELDILSTMLKNRITIVNTDTREVIRKDLNTGKYVLNNKISDLKNKGMLISKPNDKSLYISSKVIEYVKDSNVTFNFSLV